MLTIEIMRAMWPHGNNTVSGLLEGIVGVIVLHDVSQMAFCRPDSLSGRLASYDDAGWPLGLTSCVPSSRRRDASAADMPFADGIVCCKTL